MPKKKQPLSRFRGTLYKSGKKLQRASRTLGDLQALKTPRLLAQRLIDRVIDRQIYRLAEKISNRIERALFKRK